MLLSSFAAPIGYGKRQKVCFSVLKDIGTTNCDSRTLSATIRSVDGAILRALRECVSQIAVVFSSIECRDTGRFLSFDWRERIFLTRISRFSSLALAVALDGGFVKSSHSLVPGIS